MKTYLTVQLNSDGASFSEVVDLLEDLGFAPIKGQYDFMYKWNKDADIKSVIWLGDRIHEALKGEKVFFRLETVEDED